MLSWGDRRRIHLHVPVIPRQKSKGVPLLDAPPMQAESQDPAVDDPRRTEPPLPELHTDATAKSTQSTLSTIITQQSMDVPLEHSRYL